MFRTALSAPSALGQAANGSSPNFDAVIERLGGAVVASAGARLDLWGNVRVPEVTSLPGYRSSDPHSWIDVPTVQLVNYESLVGIPLRGMPTDSPGNLTLELSAAYLALEWLLDTKDGLWIYRYSNSSIPREDNVGFGGGSPNVFMDIPGRPGPHRGFNFSSKDITSKGNITQGTLVFGSAQNSTICDISHVYVDVSVECERSKQLDLTALNGTGPAAIFAALPWLTPSYHNGYKSPIENYLADPAQGI
ncbi:hypothetical protein NW754_004259 [Fusarium falciforme]|nr:hypothetical protein NW754_004259 [Fusarium falciforme]